MNNKDYIEYFECSCHSPTHHFTIKDICDIDGKYDEGPYIQIHMANYLPWHKRLWVAVKYVFGHKSKYGEYDEIILKESDLFKLRDHINGCIERRKY